ncbi:ABC transporter substrate-binding protein [Ancylomarina sp. DW003]|nr:ABC transporter substrate-binding protein [Ancylomarina sp. DW003]MDE5421358.1 ABC transporter substrate-binding protein [Ancylomarina sp. DW003]
MIKNIKIGFLAPYSSIYPEMVPSLISGFYSAIPEKYHNIFQIIPEYIGQGGEKQVIEAANKLLNFNQVDILSGLISYRILPSIIPSIENRKKMGFFFDTGEYIPYTHHISDNVFFNSFQMWQSQFALGDWAHKQFGEKGAVITPIYDGGYHLQSAFRQGVAMAGASELDFHVLNYNPEGSQVTEQIQELFQQLKKASPSFIHALFCGNEALEFYDEFCKSGLNKQIPLIVSAHMASDEILKQVSNLDLKFYSASMWNYHSKEQTNLQFKQKVNRFAGQKPDFYTLLGYETGLLFEKLIPEFQKRDWNEIKKRLKTETIEGPRGKRSFFLNSEYATPLIDIEKIAFHANSVSKIVIEQGKAMQYNHATYEKIHKENVSGWQNPYLCV